MSVFYDRLFTHRFQVPLLALERLHNIQSSLSPEEACRDVLATCCGIASPNQDDISYLVTRLEQGQKPTQSETSGPDKKTLGSAYRKMLSKMDTPNVLLWMCGYDYEKAAYLYTAVDFIEVRRMVDLFIDRQYEEHMFHFEGSMYGAGGSYKDDGGASGNVKEFDLTQGITPDMLAKINAGMH